MSELHVVAGKARPRKRTAIRAETPNELTTQTLAKAERGEDLHTAEDAADLFRQLGI